MPTTDSGDSLVHALALHNASRFLRGGTQAGSIAACGRDRLNGAIDDIWAHATCNV